MSENFPNLPAAIDAYCDAPKRTQADLSRALKVSRGTVTRWTQGAEPEVKRIQEIAKELGVSVGYLAGDDEIARNDEEIELLKNFRTQPEHIKKLIKQLSLAESGIT